MLFQDIVNFLGRELHLPDLALDEEGAFAVQLDDVIVSFVPEPQSTHFLMRAQLGTIGLADDKGLADLLAGNFFPDGVGGANLGVNDEGHVLLTQQLALGSLAFPWLLGALERFVNLAELWQNRLNASRVFPSSSAASDSMIFAIAS